MLTCADQVRAARVLGYEHDPPRLGQRPRGHDVRQPRQPVLRGGDRNSGKINQSGWSPWFIWPHLTCRVSTRSARAAKQTNPDCPPLTSVCTAFCPRWWASRATGPTSPPTGAAQGPATATGKQKESGELYKRKTKRRLFVMSAASLHLTTRTPHEAGARAASWTHPACCLTATRPCLYGTLAAPGTTCVGAPSSSSTASKMRAVK